MKSEHFFIGACFGFLFSSVLIISVNYFVNKDKIKPNIPNVRKVIIITNSDTIEYKVK